MIGPIAILLALVTTPYPTMAPLGKYFMPGNVEIALARTAAPRSISSNASVLVLGPDGFRTAVQGTNGFTCLVERSWMGGYGDRDFWNAKVRSPDCYNPAATRTALPIVLMRTKLILAGKSKDEAFTAVTAAIDSGQLPPLERGAMSYMLSRQQYLNDQVKHWHPHLMFFVPLKDGQDTGANLDGSPVIGADDQQDRLTILMVTLQHWSDGTRA